MADKSIGKYTPTAVRVAAFVIILAGMKLASTVLNPLLLAFFISIICAQPVLWLKNRNVPSGLAVLMVILLIISAYLGINWLVGSSISFFLRDIAEYQENLTEIRDSAGRFFADRGINIAVFGGSGSMDPAKVMEYTRTAITHIREMVSKEITIVFLTLFLVSEVEILRLKFMLVARGSDTTYENLQTIGKSIRHYLSIKTFTSLATGLVVGLSLAIIGVDYPVLWGTIAFILNYIPTIGSIIAAIPGITFSLIQLGFPATFWTAGVYLFANVVIGSIIDPKMMGKGMGLSTSVVFFGLIFWGFILGPVGMFLSVPITMTIKIILKMNPRTQWIASLLGTKEETLKALE